MTDDLNVARRITVGLIPAARTHLSLLMSWTELSLTDVANRAISVYFVVTRHERDGYDLVFRHRETGEERIVEII